MFLSGCKFRIFTISYSLQCSLYRNCILFAVFYTFHAADGIRMSLTNSFAPECVITSLRQNGIGIHTIQRKHSRIPAHGNNTNMSAFFCRLINIFKMLWDSCVCIKTVYDIKHLCIFWCLLRQIRSTSATENHNINLILPLLYIINRTNGCSLCQNGYCLRRTSRKYRSKLHIRILLNCTFHASSKVTIS